jgi:hypothetical protein
VQLADLAPLVLSLLNTGKKPFTSIKAISFFFLFKQKKETLEESLSLLVKQKSIKLTLLVLIEH